MNSGIAGGIIGASIGILAANKVFAMLFELLTGKLNQIVGDFSWPLWAGLTRLTICSVSSLIVFFIVVFIGYLIGKTLFP